MTGIQGPVLTNCIFLTETEMAIFNSTQAWLADFPINWLRTERVFLNFSLTGLTLGLDSRPVCFQYLVTLIIVAKLRVRPFQVANFSANAFIVLLVKQPVIKLQFILRFVHFMMVDLNYI